MAAPYLFAFERLVSLPTTYTKTLDYQWLALNKLPANLLVARRPVNN